jgi:hypothetical protein
MDGVCIESQRRVAIAEAITVIVLSILFTTVIMRNSILVIYLSFTILFSHIHPERDSLDFLHPVKLINQ